jgi:hypothetical protein
MADIGPVQLLAIGIGPAAEYRGQVLTELDRLHGRGLIRVLDLLFVGLDDDADDLVALNHQGPELGGLVGALLGFAFEGAERDPAGAPPLPGPATGGLTRTDLDEVVRSAPPGLAVGLLLVEHVWARDLQRAVAAAGGVPLAEGFLSALATAEVRDELAATVAILDELEGEGSPVSGACAGAGAAPGGASRGGLALAAEAAGRVRTESATRTVDTMERRRAMTGAPATPASRSDVRGTPSSYVAELEQLAELRSNGLISDEEYAAKKRLLLGI